MNFPRILFLTPALVLTACGDKEGDSADLWPTETADAVATYAEIVEASYADSLSSAQALAAKAFPLLNQLLLHRIVQWHHAFLWIRTLEFLLMFQ